MNLSEIRLLLVEDDLVDQMAFQRSGKDFPHFFQYEIASSLKEAGDLLTSRNFDVVVCDFMLGDGNAFDLLEKTTEIPFIFITGAGNEEIAVKAMRAGAYDYLVKDNARNYLKILPFTVQNAISQKRAFKELRKLSLVTSKTNNSVMITDQNGIIEWVNEGFSILTGYSAEEVTGKSADIMNAREIIGLPEHINPFEEVRKTKRSLVYEHRNISKDGREYWVLTTLTPLLDGQNNLENIVAVDAEITEQKKAEQAILEAKKAAEEAKLSEEAFIANTSHEIRTPMNGILGMVELLLSTSPTAEQKEFLNDIKVSASKLLYLINDILDFSKIKAGQISFENIDFNLKEITDNIRKILQLRVSEKGIRFETFIHPEVPEYLRGDPVRINQVLLNLCDNAVKFTDTGSVRLEISLLETGEIHFSVKDTGIGIPKEKISLVFEDFKQAGNETTRLYGGTGLGLSISQKLVQAMGGSIKVNSIPGKGSTFYFSLHLERGTYIQAKKETLFTEDATFSRAFRILCVEDNKINQKVLFNMLLKLGARPVVASNGKMALDLLENEEFDLILMDIRMPVMDGFETTLAIRKSTGKYKNIPIVAITASALATEKQNCLELGMDEYISKPFSPQSIYQVINNLLDRGHQNPGNGVPDAEVNIKNLNFLPDSSRLIKELVQIFAEEGPKDIESLKNAVTENDKETIHLISHRFGPSASMLGARNLAVKLKYLENKVFTASIQEIKILIEEIESLFYESLDSLLTGKTLKND